jgi:hypothetical protein
MLGKLRDNDNEYIQTWTPWLTRGAIHVAKVSDDGDFLVIGGGYLLDNELHIYRWNQIENEYTKVWEAGSGILTRDVYDVAFGDCDNNNLIEIAAACADGRVYLFEQAHISDPIANLENRFDYVWRSDNFFQASSVEFYDTDLDGLQDLIVGSWDNKIHVFEYTAHGGYPFDTEHWITLTERWNSTTLDDKIQSLAVGDFNNNGLPDMIVGTFTGSIYIFENDGLVLSPHGIEFPFPNDNNYRQIWNNTGTYQPIWHTVGQIETADLDGVEGTEAIILAWGQGAWILRYSDSRSFHLEQITQPFEGWSTQGYYPLDNYADWMVNEESMNWQVYYQHPNGSKFPEPWGLAESDEFDIFANSALTGEPIHSVPFTAPKHGGSIYNGHEYKLISISSQWLTARDDCENMGGHLATITSSGENTFVSSLAGSNNALIGLTDANDYGGEDNWQWITGENVNYTNWYGGSPSPSGDEDYVEMFSDGTWNDLANHHYRYYVCEWDYDVTDGISTTFYTNNTHQNATGTWNLGVGEEIASNGNDDPDLYIIFDPNEVTTPDPTEWNISLSNNLLNWYQLNSTAINPIMNDNGFAIDIDPLFAVKKMKSAQYIRLTLLQGNTTDYKERQINAVIFPNVARPLTLATAVTIEKLAFDYYETAEQNKIIFGCTDGRILTFKYEPQTGIKYYRKFTGKPAELTIIPKNDYGIVVSDFSQEWDSFTDDFFNLEQTIWSIQGTPKRSDIPSWRYIKGITKEIPTELDSLHLSVYDSINSTTRPEILITVNYDSFVRTYDSNTGSYVPAFEFVTVNGDTPDDKTFTLAFGDLYQDKHREELIVFPWYEAPFKRPDTYDPSLLPIVYEWNGAGTVLQNLEYFNDIDYQLYNFLSESTTYPSATIADVNNDTLQDIIISNGRLALLWNIGNASNPSFKFDFSYFKGLNERAPPSPIFSPNLWDYDKDGDSDIAYSYGHGASGDFRYGMDFFENQGTSSNPHWIRNAYMMKNPSTDGSLRFNNFTAGVIDHSQSDPSLWVWNGVDGNVRNLIAETDKQSSFIIGTNPELMKLEINQRQSPPDAINFGFSVLKSWTNLNEFDEWTLTLTTSLHLDGDNNAEIIVSDYDNNLYVFEHLTENTYKRAWKSHDLNHTKETNYSPYAFQDLDGVSGEFRKTIFDHGNLLASGLDYDKDGNEEFVLTAALSVYIFEATGYNDEFKLIFEKDYQNLITDPSITQFTALAMTPDFDGRGAMVAIAAKNYLCLLRSDPQYGWIESLQPISGIGFYGIPGIPAEYPYLDIRTLLFADLNQDGNTELWIGGQNSSEIVKVGFLLALDSNYGDLHEIYDFPAISSIVNALETVDADYDGNLELIIAHGHGLDIWEITDNEADIFNFVLRSFISSDPNYGQSSLLSPVFDTYQSLSGLAPRSQDILHLQGGNDYFSIYGVEEDNHDPVLHQDIGYILQNGTTGGGKLYYMISQDPTSSGTYKDPKYQISESFTILITEVFYPVVSSQQWVELYNPSCHNISLNGWTLDFTNGTSSISIPLSGTIYAYDYFVVVNDQAEFTSQYPSAPTPNLENSSLDLGDQGQLQLMDNFNQEEDLIGWGGWSGWSLTASGTSLVRNDTLGYIGSITPIDTNVQSDWLNTVPSGKPGQGNYSSSSSIYEYRPAITQDETGIITVAWIVEYVSSSDVSPINYGRSVNIRQFNSAGIPLSSYIEVDSKTNTNGSTGDLDYNVVYEDVAVASVRGDIVVAYIANDIAGTTSISENLYIQHINTTDWTKTNITDLVGISENYSVSSIDLANINDKIGIFFSGKPRDSYSYEQLYFTTLNETYQNEGISYIISGTGDYKYVSVTTMSNNPNNLFLASEYITRSGSELMSTFSKDGGISWSQQYELFSSNPNLEQYDIYQSLRTTGAQSPVFNRRMFSPQVTSDNTGGIYYQLTSRFLIEAGTDPDYSGNLVDYYGDQYHLVTQQWIGQLENGTWFEFDDISNVRSIAVGDSDNDLRNEIFISHNTRVSLLEIYQDPATEESYYTQEWQYEPPSFLSANPDQINSSYTQYIVDETSKKRDTGSVAIADTNGNGWPELIFTIKGGDVFSFEVKNLDQPINDIYLITEREDNLTVEFPINDTNLLITEVMYNPTNPEMKWIEIHNPTEADIDLSSWQISDNTGTFSFPPFFENISSNGYFVIAVNSTAFSEVFSTIPDMQWTDLTLNPIGDTLTLIHGGSNIDSVSWGLDAQVLGYTLTTDNETIRRISLYDTDSINDWENSETYGNPWNDPYYSLPLEISDNYLIDCNDDNNLDLIITDSANGRGIIAWDLTSDDIIWQNNIPGELHKVYLISNNSENILVCISSKGVLGLFSNGSKRYWVSAPSFNTSSSHLFADIDVDSYQDLILATKTDVRVINPLTGAEKWSNPSIDPQSEGYFDISSCTIADEVFIGVGSSDFTTYRKINILQADGFVITSFVHPSLVKFDANSKSILGDFDFDGQLDILLTILHNYDILDPQSRIEIWNTEVERILVNESLPIISGINFDSFQIIPYDVNNDSLKDLIISIPEFDNTKPSPFLPSKGFSSGVFALDITSGGTILWKRYFDDPLIKFEVDFDESVLLAYTANSGIFTISLGGADIMCITSDHNPSAISLNFAENSSVWVTYANGTCGESKVIGKLSSAKNTITEIPIMLKTTTNLYKAGEAFTIPVKLSIDDTEDLLIAYTNGTLILRSLEKEIMRISIDAFSRISATGLILDRSEKAYGLAIKSDTGNLVILDISSNTIVGNRLTTAENISTVNLGLNSDLILLQTIDGTTSKISLFDYKTNSFVWNYTNSAYLTSWKVVSLDPSLPGRSTHIVALDYSGEAHMIELPISSSPGGKFSDPTLGGKWILLETLENNDQLSEVYLLSNKTQLIHYTWLPDGTIKIQEYNSIPTMDILNLNIARESAFTYLLFVTRDEGIKVYREGLLGLFQLVGEEINSYIRSYDHRFANLDNSGENELLFIAGTSLVVKDLTNVTDPLSKDVVKEIFSFSNFISSLKIWNVDTSGNPVIITILIDGTIAIADPLGRSITSGAAAVININDLTSDYVPPNTINKENNPPILAILQIALVLTIVSGVSIVVTRRTKRFTLLSRRLK